MKNILTKLLLMVTVLSMVVSLAVVPASAATTTILLSELTTDGTTGEIVSGITMLVKETDTLSSAYYESGDEYFTLQTQSTFTNTSEAGAWAQFDFSEISTTFELQAKVGFDAQTAEISWRPYGYNTSRGTYRRDKAVYFKDGKVYSGNTQVLTYDTSKTYDLIIRYQTATNDSASDAVIMISLSDGSNVSSWTGTPNLHLSKIKGSGFVVNKPSSGFNKLKIYDGATVSSLAGIPYFGNEIEGIDFSDYELGTQSWGNGAEVPGTSTKHYTNTGNVTSIVNESEGAFDGKSMKFANGSNGSSQLRTSFSGDGPVRFEFKFKADSFGSNSTTFTGANGSIIMTLTKNGALFLGNSQSGLNELETGTWYMVRGYHNPGDISSATDDYAYLELCTTDGKVTHKKSGVLEGAGTASKGYTTIFTPVTATIYIDDFYISEASALAPSTSESFAVTSMSPSYDNSMPVYHNAQLTLTKAADIADFSADNIYICKDGTRIDATGFSWNTDNTVLSIPVNATGHYRICVFGLKDTAGTAIANPYMEFDVTSPKVVFTPSGSEVTATFKAKSSDIANKNSAVMVLAGYTGGKLVAAPVIDSKSVSDEVTTLSATLTGGNDLADVRVFILESLGSLVPLTQTTNYR